MSELPMHIGIIPDGNRRWAKAQGRPTFEGHRKGMMVAHDTANAVFDRGVKYMTAYMFSAENWSRTQEEVGYLMGLFLALVTERFWTKDLIDRGIRLRFFGRREGLNESLLKGINRLEKKTESNGNGTLAICLNYGGKDEVVDAVKVIMESGVSPDDVTPELISRNLYGPEVPPVDLLIRTSGEQRTSGFMLWRSDYSEMHFEPKMWPDFSEKDLDNALDEYTNRQRRYGK